MKLHSLISVIALGFGICPLSAQNFSQSFIDQAQQNVASPSSQSICDMPGTSAYMYNKYCVGGTGVSVPSAPVGPTPQQQFGLALGQAAMPYLQQGIHNMLYGSPAQQAAARAQRQAAALAQQQAQQQSQQLQLAARQLNDSGLYLLRQRNYAGAIHEFELALAKTPNDPNILYNLASARRQQQDASIAAQNSGALGRLLGDMPDSAESFDSSGLTHASIENPNASALNFLNLNEDSSTVDLRGATGTSVDPAALKSQLDGVFLGSGAAPAPPDPQIELPQAQDIELLFTPPQPAPSAWPGPQRPANSAKLVNPIDQEEQTKAQADAIFSQPGGLDDILEQKAQESAMGGKTSAPATPASASK